MKRGAQCTCSAPFDMLPHCATASNSRRHLAPASASARISGMEAVLGVALLERGRRGVIPTAAGRADAVARLVEAGIGVGVLPLTAIERYGSADLVPKPLTDDWAHRRLMICARRFAALSAHARRLAEEIERQSLHEPARSCPAGCSALPVTRRT